MIRRVMPDMHPIVERLDESIRETIPGLQYAVKWKNAYYGLPELGWIIEMAARRLHECRLLRRRGFRPSSAAWNHRSEPLRQADDPEEAQRSEIYKWIEQAGGVPGWK
jgi:hypothetical protein